MSDLTLEDLSPEDRKSLPHNHPLLDALAARVNEEMKLPQGLLLALKNAGEKSESKGKNSVSPKGAKGVMQFMPGTATMVELKDPTDPLEAIPAAGRYLTQLQKDLNTSDPTLLAAAYNAGPNRASLRRGEVPNIPETKDYVQRVNAYLRTVPAAPGVAPMTVGWADLTPEDRKAMRKAEPGLLDPTSGMTTYEKTMAGAGKLLTDTGRGIAQVVSENFINPISQKLVGRDLVQDMRGEEAERRIEDAALMDTGAGMGGYLGAAALTTALPGSWLSKAAPVVKATQVLSKVPLVGAVAPLAVPAAVTGGALSALAPVVNDGERMDNATTGALAGAVLGPASALVGKGIAKVAAPAVNYVGSKVNIPGLWKPSMAAKMAPAEREAIDTAMEHGVPVYSSQVRKPGSSLPPGRAAAQKDAFDRAIARSFGEDTDDLVKAFSSANERLSGNYNKLLDGKVIPLDKTHITDLKAVSQYNASRSPRFAPNADLEDMVQRAIAAAKQDGQMTGRDYQNALQQYKAMVTQLSKSTETRPADYHAAQGASKLIDALTKQAEKVMSKEELALFRETNKQWRNMTTLEGLAPKGADGSVSVKQLANVLARKRKGEFVYGKGDQTLPNLARFGNTYMGLESTAPKGFINQGKEFARSAAPFIAGDVAGAYLMGNAMGGDHAPADSVAGELMKYGALGLLTHGVLTTGRNAMNPALARKDLFAPQGALGSVFSRVQPGAATGLTLNAAEDR